MGWVVLHGCVVHVDVHGEVMLWMTSRSLLLSMADVISSCMQKLWECINSAESVWHV